ncbi:MAG: hypothetical protein L6R30_22370 [Thermoanaerobaculia bacterium]|nr:hypothetical protein [Thermoanaerobaculia bacterium]
MRSPTSTRGWPVWAVGLVLLAGLLLVGLPAFGQAIKVTSAVPDTTEQGVVGLVVAIAGDNFASGAKVNFYVTGTKNPGGIAVKSVKFKDAKNLEATIDVAADAQTELKFDIEVRCNGRTGKGTELFKVSVKTTGGDLTPPGTVTDLSVLERSFNKVVLTWTTPADDAFDAGSGPAAQYDIRIRRGTLECGPFTMADWADDGATWLRSDPCAMKAISGPPDAPGAAAAWPVTAIPPNTEFWAALRTADDSPQGPNWSDPSEPQLLFTTAAFPPEGWTAPWTTQIVDSCPLADTSCHISGMPRLGFDAGTQYPVVVFGKDYSGAVARWNGSAWSTEALPVAIDTGYFRYDFAIDPVTGDETIATIVRGSTGNDVRFYRRTGTSWQTDVVATGSVDWASLGFDSVGHVPTIAYQYSKGKTPSLRVAQRYGSTWSTETVASSAAGAQARPVVFDPDGNPAVAFAQQVSGASRLAFAIRNGGAWTVELPDSGAPGAPYTVNDTAVAVSRGIFSVLARYHSAGDNQLRYCRRTVDPVAWSCELVAQGLNIGPIYLAADDSGTTYVAYRAYGQETNFIMLVRATGSASWAAEYIDWNAMGQLSGGILIGPDGKAAIVYGGTNDATGFSTNSVVFARRQ